MLRHESYTRKADLWSVGVVLYEALIGRTPYTGVNYADLLRNIELKRTEAESLVFPKQPPLSAACRQLLAGLLCRAPNSRYALEDLVGHTFLVLPTTNKPALTLPNTQGRSEAGGPVKSPQTAVPPAHPSNTTNKP